MIQAVHTYPKIPRRSVLRSLVKESFYDFIVQFWSVTIPEDPVWNWHIKYIADEMQAAAERVFVGKPKEYDLIINVPPGTTKSTICSVMFGAWTIARMPSARHINASHTSDLVNDHSRRCRLIIQSELYQEVFPEVRLSRDQNVKTHWTTTAGGGRLCSTVAGKTPTGFHAHFLGVDDPLNPFQALQVSEADIKSANDFMTEVLPSRKVDKAVAFTYLIMQRLHQNDPTGYLLSKGKENIKHICLPAERSKDVVPGSLRSRYKDRLLDPVRLDKDVLAEAEVDLGPFGFSGQYLQDPIPRGGGVIKIDKMIKSSPPSVYDPRWWKKLIRYWDKAGTAGGGAYTAGVLLGITKQIIRDGAIIRESELWLLHVVRGQWASPEREKTIRETAERDGKHVRIAIEQEPGSGGKESADNTVRNLRGYRVTVDIPSGKKDVRAEPFADQVARGLVYIAEGEWNQDWLDEAKFWPRSKYKDQIDSTAGAFNLMDRKKVAGAV